MSRCSEEEYHTEEQGEENQEQQRDWGFRFLSLERTLERTLGRQNPKHSHSKQVRKTSHTQKHTRSQGKPSQI